MVENDDGDSNDWNTTYKFFKLLVVMNSYEDLVLHLDDFNMFSLSSFKVDTLLQKWVTAFYNVKYNKHLWIKERVLDRLSSKCCVDFKTANDEFTTHILYKNIINQFANDKLQELGVLQILWELFYLETKPI
jgi:hypothetical protein